MTHTIGKLTRSLSRHLTSLAAAALLVGSMGGTWAVSRTASAAPSATAAAPTGNSSTSPRGTVTMLPEADAPAPKKSSHKDLVGKLNINTATPEQLQLLPTVGPSKAERVVEWRKRNGGFKRTADLRRVKGFGYKTFKRLEPFLDIKGDTTLAAR